MAPFSRKIWIKTYGCQMNSRDSETLKALLIQAGHGIVENEKDADAVAWAWVNKEKVVKYPFKFPPLAPNEIRANVLYVGLCHSDIFHVRDLWHNVMPTTYPLVPGHEFVCEVSQIGSEVKGFKKGDKVGFGTKRACCGKCAVCLSGDDELCSDVKDDLTYGRYFGGYATQVQQPYDFFFKLPDNFKLNLGSPLFCAGITTFFLFKNIINLV